MAGDSSIPSLPCGIPAAAAPDMRARSEERRLLGMDELSRQVLKLFIAMGAESLDLHTLFEAGGNDPASRQRVLDVVTRLADTGYLESQGSDFYLLTDKGRMAAR